MITFGYKTPWSGIVRALASLGLGILAVTYPGDVIPLLVKIFAVLLGLYGLGMLIFAFVNRDEKLFSLWLSNSLIEMVVAVLVFIFAGFIANCSEAYRISSALFRNLPDNSSDKRGEGFTFRALVFCPACRRNNSRRHADVCLPAFH